MTHGAGCSLFLSSIRLQKPKIWRQGVDTAVVLVVMLAVSVSVWGVDVLSSELKAWLQANSSPGYDAWLRAQAQVHAGQLRALGVDLTSELAELYLQHGAGNVRGWYELLEPDQLAEATAHVQAEWGVPAPFLALTGIEGQGVVLYDRRSGALYDAPLDRLDALRTGQLPALADSVAGFLAWCRARDVARGSDA